MNKKVTLGAAICFMGIVAAITFVITMIFSMGWFNNKMARVKEREQLYVKIAEIDNIVQKNFVDQATIDKEVLFDAMSQGYIAGLNDKYAAYYTPEELQKEQQSNEGVLVGIGVAAIKDESGYIKITEVYASSPASESGLQKDDLIIKVADQDVVVLGYDEALSAVAGEAGTKIKITYRRSGEDKDLELVRKKVEIPSVTYRMIGENGYIKISGFNAATVAQFESALNACIKSDAKGLIFDVRNNCGGTLDSVQEILDKLLPAGVIAYQRGQDGKQEVLGIKSDASEVEMPMVVLANGNTASAAELFVSALRDYNKAKSVGAVTYGKGIMQDMYTLSDGSAIKITTAYFDPPKSDNFHGVGIKPDFPVALTADQEKNFEQLNETTDPQLKKAIEVISAKEMEESNTTTSSSAETVSSATEETSSQAAK
ncbi:MAG: S41 family peptidase [Oscillospiraceae bacterium]|nr:S41 family peptidase [Oscillospiraceae bacterium]